MIYDYYGLLIANELKTKRLLLIACRPMHHKRFYQYYYYMGEYVAWIMGTAFLRPEGLELLKSMLTLEQYQKLLTILQK